VADKIADALEGASVVELPALFEAV
jgi:hypothetical protein